MIKNGLFIALFSVTNFCFSQERTVFPFSIKGKTGYIDTNYSVIQEPQFNSFQYLKNGYNIIYKNDYSVCVLDSLGKFVFPLSSNYFEKKNNHIVNASQDSLKILNTDNGKIQSFNGNICHFICKKDKNTHIIFYKNDKASIYDLKNRKLLSNSIFEYIVPFREYVVPYFGEYEYGELKHYSMMGFAPFNKYLFKDYENINSDSYELFDKELTTFTENHAIVFNQQRFGIINLSTGKLVIPCVYDYIQFDLFENKLLVVGTKKTITNVDLDPTFQMDFYGSNCVKKIIKNYSNSFEENNNYLTSSVSDDGGYFNSTIEE